MLPRSGNCIIFVCLTATKILVPVPVLFLHKSSYGMFRSFTHTRLLSGTPAGKSQARHLPSCPGCWSSCFVQAGSPETGNTAVMRNAGCEHAVSTFMASCAVERPGIGCTGWDRVGWDECFWRTREVRFLTVFTVYANGSTPYCAIFHPSPCCSPILHGLHVCRTTAQHSTAQHSTRPHRNPHTHPLTLPRNPTSASTVPLLPPSRTIGLNKKLTD